MIRIYGHSDDVIVIDDHGKLDEIGAYDRARVIAIGGEGEGVEVTVEYAPSGAGATWQFALRQIEEDVPCPWPIRIETEHGYSLAVVIDCPPGTPIDHEEEE